jgi:hypothetical protein
MPGRGYNLGGRRRNLQSRILGHLDSLQCIIFPSRRSTGFAGAGALPPASAQSLMSEVVMSQTL